MKKYKEMEWKVPWYMKWYLEAWEKIAIAIIFIIFAIILQIMALWAIDISVAALLIRTQVGEEIALTNGFSIRDPMQMYHIGLYAVVISTFMMTSLFVFYLMKTYKKKE